MQLCPVEYRRAGTEDAHAVNHLVGRELRLITHPTGDDSDVVIRAQSLAQLREQVGGRLDAWPVVLVEDEKAGFDSHRVVGHGNNARREVKA